MIEIDVEGFGRVQIGQLNAFDQFFIFRKLTPILGDIPSEVFSQLDGESKELPPGLLATVLKAISMSLSKMERKDSEDVIKICLSCVRRQVGHEWAPILAPNGHPMFQDLRLPAMLNIAMQVIMENMTDFFPGAQPSSTAPPKVPASS